MLSLIVLSFRVLPGGGGGAATAAALCAGCSGGAAAATLGTGHLLWSTGQPTLSREIDDRMCGM